MFTIFTIYLLFWLNKGEMCSKISETTNILKYGAYGKLKDNYLLLIMQMFFIGLASNTDHRNIHEGLRQYNQLQG